MELLVKVKNIKTEISLINSAKLFFEPVPREIDNFTICYETNLLTEGLVEMNLWAIFVLYWTQQTVNRRQYQFYFMKAINGAPFSLQFIHVEMYK